MTYYLKLMDSKLAPTTSTGQCSVLAGHRTDPITHAVKDCISDGRKKTSKRNSDKSLEGSSKRRRTSSSEGCSQTSGPSTVSIANLRIESEDMKSRNWKSEETEEPRKRSTKSKSEETEEPRKSSKKRKSKKTEEPRKRSTKSKSEETEEPRKRSRNTSRSPEAPSDHGTKASTSDKPGTSSSSTTVSSNSRDAFKAKYKQLKTLLGQGGFGLVFAGLRRDDNLPVAIKHIYQQSIERTSVTLDGKNSEVPLEVALMLKVKPAAGETSAAIALLDWYDLDGELILILERPVPCMNLKEYAESRMYMPEHEVKIIVKQLVNALIEIHSRGVLHRDIKPQNILIETGSDVPRVRIIDFGCGTYLTRGQYFSTKGTLQFIPPEWYRFRSYRAEPMTVWQLGVVLFRILHGYLPFNNSHNIIHSNPVLRDGLSSNCQDFLLKCLIKWALLRPKLKTLKKHPWLM